MLVGNHQVQLPANWSVKEERRSSGTDETQNDKSPGQKNCPGLCAKKNGGVLLSHTVARAVPSAQKSLTSVFGMGTGGIRSQKSEDRSQKYLSPVAIGLKQKVPQMKDHLGDFYKGIRRRPTLPHSRPCSTIGAEELNFRVRNGNGWNLFAITTEKSV